jgi:hypothetical protein
LFQRGIGLSISILAGSMIVELLIMMALVMDRLMEMIARGKIRHQMWPSGSGKGLSCFNIHFITGRSRL